MLTDRQHATLSVLVPKKDSAPHAVIKPKSAVVGVVHSAQNENCVMLDVYYEGNLYGAVNLVEYDDRLQCAAGRLLTRYPTVARGFWLVDMFDIVGRVSYTYDSAHKLWRRGDLVISDRKALDAWLQ
jgi:hypothetical protein